MQSKHWPPRIGCEISILIVCIISVLSFASERGRGHQILEELNADSISRLESNDKDRTDLKGLRDMAIIHKKRFGLLDVDSLKDKINPTRLEKRKGKPNLFLSSGIDSVLFQIETAEGQTLDVVVDQILDLDSPEYIKAKDSISSGTNYIWCHVGNDSFNKFIVTMSKQGVHGSIPIPNSKKMISISPLGRNRHLVLELTPNSTNPRWEGKE